jgi:hypothetical protein
MELGSARNFFPSKLVAAKIVIGRTNQGLARQHHLHLRRLVLGRVIGDNLRVQGSRRTATLGSSTQETRDVANLNLVRCNESYRRIVADIPCL